MIPGASQSSAQHLVLAPRLPHACRRQLLSYLAGCRSTRCLICHRIDRVSSALTELLDRCRQQLADIIHAPRPPPKSLAITKPAVNAPQRARSFGQRPPTSPERGSSSHSFRETLPDHSSLASCSNTLHDATAGHGLLPSGSSMPAPAEPVDPFRVADDTARTAPKEASVDLIGSCSNGQVGLIIMLMACSRMVWSCRLSCGCMAGTMPGICQLAASSAHSQSVDSSHEPTAPATDAWLRPAHLQDAKQYARMRVSARPCTALYRRWILCAVRIICLTFVLSLASGKVKGMMGILQAKQHVAVMLIVHA